MSDKKEKVVKPNDDVKVYATKKLSSLYKVGEEITVHSVQAEKLIASGKATKDKPKGGKKEDEAPDGDNPPTE